MNLAKIVAAALISITLASGLKAAEAGAFGDLKVLAGETSAAVSVTMPAHPVPTSPAASDKCPKPHHGNIQEIQAWLNCLQLPKPEAPKGTCEMPKPGAPLADVITWLNCVQLPPAPANNGNGTCEMPKPGAPLADVIAWLNCVQLPPPPSAIKAGTYRISTEYTEGELTIKQGQPGDSGALEFSLFTVSGPTSHMADISGRISQENGKAVYKDGLGCELHMEFSGPVVRLSGGDATCRDYMGARGAVDGIYMLQ